MDTSELLIAMRRNVEQVAAFNELAKALTSTLDLKEVLDLLMQKVAELLKPAHWSLVLFDEASGELYFERVVGEAASKLEHQRFAPGEGIAGVAFTTGQTQVVNDVSAEPRFSPRFDRVTEFRTRSVLAVPLKVRGKPVGVLELVGTAGAPPFSAEDQQAAGAIADFAAIAIDNAHNFRRVQELTLTDEHTGLFNARHLRALLDHEVLRANRFNHPLSLVFIDLDNFKRINDGFGHLAGSALLKEVGEVLKSGIRQVDAAFRYGGDEFVLLLVETPAAGAKIVAERLRDAFRGRKFLKGQSQPVTMTASFGVASYPKDAEDGTALIKAADRAMYQVKASGRNDVAYAS